MDCAFYDMDTNRVYAWQSDRSIVAIDCTAVENAEAYNLYQRSELDYLIWNDPTAYAELILNGEPQEYLKTNRHGLFFRANDVSSPLI